MGSSVISLGLGLGGGKAATSSGRLAGGAGGGDQLAYPNGLFTSSNFVIDVQPVYHFDASILDGASASNNPSDGTAVSTWGNRSGQSTDYDAIQSTANRQPVFRGNYLEFDGFTDFLTVNNSPGFTKDAAFTLITVAYKEGTTVSFAPVGRNPRINSYYLPLNFTNGVTYFLDNSNASVSTAGYGPHFNSIQQFVLTKDTSNNGNYFLQGNNSYKSYTRADTISGAFGTIGHNGYYHYGRIYEVLLFDSLLSNANLNVIRTYFNTKYTDLPASTSF